MTITVYYCTDPTTAVYEPVPIFKELREEFNLNTDFDFLSCPAFQASCKNVFKIIGTVDYDLTWTGENFTSNSYDQLFFDNYIINRGTNSGFFSYKDPIIRFFTDSNSLNCELLPPYLHKSEVNNLRVITGKFDIGKHFRVIELAAQFRKPSTVNFNAQEPVYYIKFYTDEKIIFKRFYYTPVLHNITGSYLYLRFHTKKIAPLEWWYNHNSIYKRKILKEIKENLF